MIRKNIVKIDEVLCIKRRIQKFIIYMFLNRLIKFNSSSNNRNTLNLKKSKPIVEYGKVFKEASNKISIRKRDHESKKKFIKKSGIMQKGTSYPSYYRKTEYRKHHQDNTRRDHQLHVSRHGVARRMDEYNNVSPSIRYTNRTDADRQQSVLHRTSDKLLGPDKKKQRQQVITHQSQNMDHIYNSSKDREKEQHDVMLHKAKKKPLQQQQIKNEYADSRRRIQCQEEAVIASYRHQTRTQSHHRDVYDLPVPKDLSKGNHEIHHPFNKSSRMEKTCANSDYHSTHSKAKQGNKTQHDNRLLPFPPSHFSDAAHRTLPISNQNESSSVTTSQLYPKRPPLQTLRSTDRVQSSQQLSSRNKMKEKNVAPEHGSNFSSLPIPKPRARRGQKVSGSDESDLSDKDVDRMEEIEKKMFLPDPDSNRRQRVTKYLDETKFISKNSNNQNNDFNFGGTTYEGRGMSIRKSNYEEADSDTMSLKNIFFEPDYTAKLYERVNFKPQIDKNVNENVNELPNTLGKKDISQRNSSDNVSLNLSSENISQESFVKKLEEIYNQSEEMVTSEKATKLGAFTSHAENKENRELKLTKSDTFFDDIVLSKKVKEEIKQGNISGFSSGFGKAPREVSQIPDKVDFVKLDKRLPEPENNDNENDFSYDLTGVSFLEADSMQNQKTDIDESNIDQLYATVNKKRKGSDPNKCNEQVEERTFSNGDTEQLVNKLQPQLEKDTVMNMKVKSTAEGDINDKMTEKTEMDGSKFEKTKVMEPEYAVPNKKDSNDSILKTATEKEKGDSVDNKSNDSDSVRDMDNAKHDDILSNGDTKINFEDDERNGSDLSPFQEWIPSDKENLGKLPKENTENSSSHANFRDKDKPGESHKQDALSDYNEVGKCVS